MKVHEAELPQAGMVPGKRPGKSNITDEIKCTAIRHGIVGPHFQGSFDAIHRYSQRIETY